MRTLCCYGTLTHGRPLTWWTNHTAILWSTPTPIETVVSDHPWHTLANTVSFYTLFCFLVCIQYSVWSLKCFPFLAWNYVTLVDQLAFWGSSLPLFPKLPDRGHSWWLSPFHSLCALPWKQSFILSYSSLQTWLQNYYFWYVFSLKHHSALPVCRVSPLDSK